LLNHGGLHTIELIPIAGWSPALKLYNAPGSLVNPSLLARLSIFHVRSEAEPGTGCMDLGAMSREQGAGIRELGWMDVGCWILDVGCITVPCLTGCLA